MITFEEVLARVQPLKPEELELWIERQWVLPERQDGETRFAEIDLARIRLIHDFRHTMGIATETLPVVLSLIDQIYTMRRQMRGLMNAIDSLPPETRQSLIASLGGKTGPEGAGPG